jgi:serine/threonine protein kinase
MGEVNCARDTRLQRVVALNILPQSLSSDQDRLGRFQQKPRILGALNHPSLMPFTMLARSAGFTSWFQNFSKARHFTGSHSVISLQSLTSPHIIPTMTT